MKDKTPGVDGEWSRMRRKLVLAGACVPVLGLGMMPLMAHAQTSAWTPPVAVKFDYSLQGQWMGDISGTGTFNWAYAPGTGAYSMEVDISAFLMSFFYASKGRYDPAVGILPASYREKRIGRDRTVSFNYPNETLSYSWKPKHETRPLEQGVQDAISVLMQMIHQMINGVEALQAGQEFVFPIARMGSVKAWSFSVIGTRNVQVKTGVYETWHIKWLSPKGDEATIVEMWLAPKLSYMPVKLYYWSEDGSKLDILLDRIRAFQV